ncbi:MAG: histidinol-phosphate transaminase [Pseudomonadota bacterium]|nr:MAG: histidinol-phosphate transaminase [Pseudomonadota bacterium]
MSRTDDPNSVPLATDARGTKDLVSSLVRPEIRALSAYHVPDARGMIKLDAMENPYRLPEAVVAQWLEVLRNVELNRYPDPDAAALKKALHAAMSVPRRSALLLGNGSDELIQMVMMAIAAPRRVVLSVEPGFVMYRMLAVACGMKYIGAPLQADFSLDMPALTEAIRVHAPAVIFLAYPNNPTGNLFDAEQVHDIIAAAPGLVVIDEAYHAFAESSFMGALGEYRNLLVMRTLSKVGLAGLRLGMLAGAPPWLDELNKVRLPYNINALTQASAEFALRHQAVFDEQTHAVCEQRDALLATLADIEGIEPYPSRANFILFRVSEGGAGEVFAALQEQGVLIKNLDPAGGMLRGCLRVTVGTPEENQVFVAALRTALA